VIGGPALAPFDLRMKRDLESGLHRPTRPISLVTTDGVALAGLHWPSHRAPAAAIVLVHGLAASKDHPDIEVLAGRLQKNRFEVLSYDARGHGASAGTYTLGHLEHLDVEAAAAWARGRGVPTILIGASLGGVAALRYSCDHPELAGVVIVSSPAEWRIPLRVRALLTAGLVRTRPGRWVARRRMGVRITSRWTAADPPQTLTERVACPLAVVHGRRDALIPVRRGLEFQLRADSRRYVVLANDMGHAFDPKGHDAICAAVDWTLAQKS
jgi:pimeloyl-ACP methyl ester carboxylesterase